MGENGVIYLKFYCLVFFQVEIMKLRTFFLLAFFLLTAGAVSAQNVPTYFPDYAPEEVKAVKKKHKHRNKKDRVRFGVKFSYNAHLQDVYDYDNMAVSVPSTVQLIGNTTVGPALRIPLGRVLYLQGEALFGIRSDWARTSEQEGFWNQLDYSYKNRTGSYMWVPVYAGVRWAPVSLFALRGFVGPRFNFAIENKNYTYQKEYYTLSAGAGLDLLKVFSFELGYNVDMNRLKPVDGSGLWFFGAALMF